MNDYINFTDIHSHILYGVDDGAQTLEESLNMIEMAQDEGVATIILTPHYECRNENYDVELVEKNYRKLCEASKENYPNMDIHIGNEILFSNNCIEALNNKSAMTLAGTRYVLVEFGIRVEYKEIYDAVRNLCNNGYIPIIAHMERYNSIFKKNDLLDELHKAGGYLQINSRSLTRGRLNSVSSWVNKLVKDGAIDFISDDCHNTSFRCPLMRSVIDNLEHRVDKNVLKRILVENPKKLLSNEYI